MKLSLPALNSYDTAGDENRDPAAGRRMMMGRDDDGKFFILFQTKKDRCNDKSNVKENFV